MTERKNERDTMKVSKCDRDTWNYYKQFRDTHSNEGAPGVIGRLLTALKHEDELIRLLLAKNPDPKKNKQMIEDTNWLDDHLVFSTQVWYLLQLGGWKEASLLIHVAKQRAGFRKFPFTRGMLTFAEAYAHLLAAESVECESLAQTEGSSVSLQLALKSCEYAITTIEEFLKTSKHRVLDAFQVRAEYSLACGYAIKARILTEQSFLKTSKLRLKGTTQREWKKDLQDKWQEGLFDKAKKNEQFKKKIDSAEEEAKRLISGQKERSQFLTEYAKEDPDLACLLIASSSVDLKNALGAGSAIKDYKQIETLFQMQQPVKPRALSQQKS
jgi:hypothetical protein